MLKIAQVTVNTIGEVSVNGIELTSLKHEVVLRHLGVDKLCKMDEVKESWVHGSKTITVVLAQDKPWTYITHTFVQSK